MNNCATRVKNIWTRFFTDQDGAVTMDWVVVTAISLSLFMGVYRTFAVSPPSELEANMDQHELEYSFEIWMEENGYTQGPKRSLTDRIIRKIQMKMLIFKACLGFGMTFEGQNIIPADTSESMCDNL